ncbi:GNAT family protein [Pontimicrobium sp. SW4]|uniref:GNAT family protein n=1 Tax=Pontimicrobium sp. SW4 TaxID=3153519 RepID=A0AAU7BRJ4_9FLAO
MRLSFDSFYIVPIQLKDAWSLCNFIVSNEDRLKRYFPKTLSENLTPTLSQFFVEKKVRQFKLKEEFLFTLKEEKTNALVGLIYLKELNWNKKQGEFAYCIGYPFKGQGLTSKAIKELSNHAFETLGVETLQIIAHRTNIGSIKVAENNNFKWVKTLVKGFTPTNEDPIDMELYELYKQ